MPDDARAKEFVVDGIFPRNLIHLIAAPVGTGKTTLFMQQIDAMQRGQLFLGKQSYPSRVVYITADRGAQETAATLKRLGLPDVQLRLVSLKDMSGPTVPYLEVLLDQHCVRGDLVIVEPFNFFLRDGQNRGVGDINNFGHVSHFLLRVGKKVEELGITIEGSLHSSKAKHGSEYMVAREKVLGSVAWTAFTATTIVIEPANPTVVDDPGRTIHVLPRDIRPFTLDYIVEPTHGLLIPTAVKPFKSRLDELLEAHEGPFTTEDIERWMEEANVSLRTTTRWLKQKIEDGYVERIDRGIYRKRPRN